MLQPVLRPLLVEDDRRGLGLRVVLADRLDRAPVARRAFVGDDDPPDRVLLRTHPSESYPHSHWTGQGTESRSRTREGGREIAGDHDRGRPGAEEAAPDYRLL